MSQLFPLLLAGMLPEGAATPETAAPATDPRVDAVLADLAKVRNIEAAALSPDGRRLAWVIADGGLSAITVADADGTHARPVSADGGSGTWSEADIAWAPDSRHLAFVANRRVDLTSTQPMENAIYLADTAGDGAPKPVAQLAGHAHALQWSGDGRTLGFLYVPGATRRASALAAAKPLVGEIGVDDVEVQRVACVDVSDGSLRVLTPEDLHAYEFHWSPDAARIACVAAPPPGDNNWWLAKLYVQDAAPGASPRVLVDPGTTAAEDLRGLQIALPRWSPDGSRIAFIGGLMSDQGATGGDLWMVAAAGGAPVNLTPGLPATPAWFAWTDAAALLVNQVKDGQSQLAGYALDGAAATVERVFFTLPARIGDGSAAMALSLARDARSAAFVQSSFAAAPEVHAGVLGSTPPPAVTSLNAGCVPAWGPAESVEWENEGFRLQGWLLYPAGYDPRRTYPMIVSIHGGPASAVLPRWPAMGFGPVSFSALGYFVFMPNPRGSFGQGAACVQANRRDFGHGDLRDTLAGIDAVERRVPVDEHRLGLTGWSYGGFMSMFAPTQTGRFRAVVAGAGIANWQSYYGQNLIDQWMLPFFGATVYDDPAVYARSSAIHHVKAARAPMLIVVGDRDAECPAPQSFEMWHALRAHGVPTSLVVYPDEGHRFVDPAHQRDVLQRALGWFVRYLPPER